MSLKKDLNNINNNIILKCINYEGYAVNRLTKNKFYAQQGKKDKWSHIPVIDDKNELNYFSSTRFIVEGKN